MAIGRPLLGLVALGLAACAVQAQQSTSHTTRIGDDWNASSNRGRAQELDQMLKQRLGATNTPLPQVDPAVIQKLLDMVRDNPQVLQGALDNNPELLKKFTENPDLRNALPKLTADNPELQKQLAERVRAREISRPGAETQNLERLLERLNRRDNTGATFDPGRVAPPMGDPMGRTPSSTDSSEQPLSLDRPGPDPNAERFRDFVSRLEKSVPTKFRDSDAMQRLSDRIGKVDWDKKLPKLQFWPEGKGPKLEFGDRFRGTGRAMNRLFDRLSGQKAPTMPSVRGPNLPNVRAPELPTFGVPSGPGSFEVGGTFTAILVVAGLILGSLLLYWLVVKPSRGRAESDDAWQPGPWPVEPGLVQTREDVVRAFDHLALVQGGKEARIWHHREVAHHLGTDDERRLRAQRLAGVYEQARYTTPAELLPQPHIDAARRDLCSLAGTEVP